MSFSQLLAATLDPSTNVEAEKRLIEAQEADLPQFLALVTAELASEAAPLGVRQLAGTILKNLLTAKDAVRREQLFQRWLTMPEEARQMTKQGCLATLASPQQTARYAAAQVIAKIAAIDIPAQRWPDLITLLLANMTMPTSSEFLRQSTLETLGFMCEELDAASVGQNANEILTAVVEGMCSPHVVIKQSACNALYNMLEFAQANMETEKEREYIMKMVCDCAESPHADVRKAALECCVRIAELYYDKLAGHIQKLFELTISAISSGIEEVALQGVEFWSTVCEEEIDIMDEILDIQAQQFESGDMNTPLPVCLNLIKGALRYLVPMLLQCLSKQGDSDDDDAWDLSMAGAICLRLIASVVQDQVVPFVVEFVQTNINHADWRLRDAAIMAFGSILDGPENLGDLIYQALPELLKHTQDSQQHVRDTTAWTLGEVCRMHHESIRDVLPALVDALEAVLQKEAPHVTGLLCAAVHNLAISREKDKQQKTLSPYFTRLASAMFVCTERPDADEGNLRVSAFEALNQLIQAASSESVNDVTLMLPVFVGRLQAALSPQFLPSLSSNEKAHIHGSLCSVIYSIVLRLSKENRTEAVFLHADAIMTCFINVLNSPNQLAYDECLLAIGGVASVLGEKFITYMEVFVAFLLRGLQTVQEHQVCSVAVGVVEDVSRALSGKMTPFCTPIIQQLLRNLQDPQLNRNVKTHILAVFGDIALAIGSDFEIHLRDVMSMLRDASLTEVKASDAEQREYLNELRESIFEAYVGIVHGLHVSSRAAEPLAPFVPNILQFIRTCHRDNLSNVAVTRVYVGLLGDLAKALGVLIKALLSQASVSEILQETAASADKETRKNSAYALKEIAAIP